MQDFTAWRGAGQPRTACSRTSWTAAKPKPRGWCPAGLGAWTASVRRQGRGWDLNRGDAAVAINKW